MPRMNFKKAKRFFFHHLPMALMMWVLIAVAILVGGVTLAIAAIVAIFDPDRAHGVVKNFGEALAGD